MSSSQRTLLFLGDSLIEFFDWQGWFSNDTVESFGIAGETVQELFQRSAPIASRKPSPDFILIMIGTNNIVMDDFSFIPTYEKIIETLQNGLPNTEIVVNGLFPCRLPWLSADAIPQINTLLEGLARTRKIGYLDGCHIFSHKACNTRPFFLEDGVHLSDYGYTIWAQAIEEYLFGMN